MRVARTDAPEGILTADSTARSANSVVAFANRQCDPLVPPHGTQCFRTGIITKLARVVSEERPQRRDDVNESGIHEVCDHCLVVRASRIQVAKKCVLSQRCKASYRWNNCCRVGLRATKLIGNFAERSKRIGSHQPNIL